MQRVLSEQTYSVDPDQMCRLIWFFSGAELTALATINLLYVALSMLGRKFGGQLIEICFLFFTEKRFCHFMHIV